MNKTSFQKMNELILQDHPEFPGLIDLGSFTIHPVHNAFGKGMEQFEKEMDQLCIDMHSLFTYSAGRWEDLKNSRWKWIWKYIISNNSLRYIG